MAIRRIFGSDLDLDYYENSPKISGLSCVLQIGFFGISYFRIVDSTNFKGYLINNKKHSVKKKQYKTFFCLFLTLNKF